MALITYVKVGNITNLSDARYCAAMGVSQLGFCIDKDNENYVDPATFNDIKKWIEGVDIVAETNCTLNQAEGYAYDVLQCCYTHCANKNIQVARQTVRFSLAQLPNINPGLLSDFEYILLEGVEEQLSTDQKNSIREIGRKIPVVMGCGFDVHTDIPAFVDDLGLKGIALRGSREIRPGFKDYDALALILEKLEDD
ncbi:MAG: hypothetical protein OEX02_17260 [Cyclobacteriaceae bacterium]|nr:hypothetical protein [Cyclobacteriaceae bacterium]